ncbi:MAG: hypothetical protein WBZ39_03490 [Methylovirgula sp.]
MLEHGLETACRRRRGDNVRRIGEVEGERDGAVMVGKRVEFDDETWAAKSTTVRSI